MVTKGASNFTKQVTKELIREQKENKKKLKSFKRKNT